MLRAMEGALFLRHPAARRTEDATRQAVGMRIAPSPRGLIR
jgi:hypothetical protein